ncbi:MAG: DUF4261 domain-containing protein [Alphaproteobacteria bacterium]|nr:DUF4261 domain-containing protein [Alphaproteobacteria bacterium SS10]
MLLPHWMNGVVSYRRMAILALAVVMTIGTHAALITEARAQGSALPTVNPGDGPQGRMIAFVLQAQPEAVNPAAMQEQISGLLPADMGSVRDFVDPNIPASEGEAASIIGRTQEAFPMVEGAVPALFRVYDVPILMVPVAVPVPRQEFAAAWQARRQFAEAPEILSSHQGHTIIFALVDPQTTAEQVRAAEALSAVVAAMATGSTNVLGVHWSSADLSIPPGAFVNAFQKTNAEATAALADSKPVRPVWHQLITMWIDIDAVTAPLFQQAYAAAEPDAVPAWVPEGSVGLITRGLASFIGREIEMAPSDRPPNEQALALVHVIAYLLDRGQLFREGDTLGFGEERLIEASLRDSSALIGGSAETAEAVKILRLTYRLVEEGEAQSLQ